MNIYTPNQSILDFWQQLLENSLIDQSTILWRYLNFSIGPEEFWGHHSQLDPLSDQLSILLEKHGLIDVPMNKKLPTWHNRRIGDAALWRRLDMYLIHEYLLTSLTNYRQWVGTRGISYHSPIYLEVACSFKKPRAPFNFNLTCLKDPEYLR